MSNALGPVVNNRLAGANKAVPKPHLRERLAQQSSRTTPQGTLTTDTQGRKSFAPNYLVSALERSQAKPHSMAHMAFQPGQRVRVCATVDKLLGQAVFPFDSEDAKALVGCDGVVIADRECTALGLVLVRIYSEPWAFLPVFLLPVPAAEGDDEQDAMTNGPAFDPLTEPLHVGDYVEVVCRNADGTAMRDTGKRGHIYAQADAKLGLNGFGWCYLAYDDGTRDDVRGDGWGFRCSFRLIAKAPPTTTPAAWGSANGCPF